MKTFYDGQSSEGYPYKVPFVSSQSWRRWLRDTLIEETGWSPSRIRALHNNPKGNTDKTGGEFNPIEFPEDDEEKIKIHLGIDLHDEERTGSSEHSHYSILNDVLETYLIYKKSSKQVEFSHKSLQEFLIAEHYLEQYFNGNDNLRLLNVSKPSKTTIDFLKGLIQILSLSSGNEVSKKYLGNDPKDQFGLFSSIISDDHNNNEGSISLEYIKETVAANAKKAFRLKSLPSVNILTAKNKDQFKQAIEFFSIDNNSTTRDRKKREELLFA